MQFLVAIHHPDNFDGSTETEQTRQEIDELNEEMIAKGVRLFAGGLNWPHTAKSLTKQDDGEIAVTDGPFLPGSIHVGGFWIIEAESMDEALEWGRKAVKACKTPVEVRQFFQ